MFQLLAIAIQYLKVLLMISRACLHGSRSGFLTMHYKFMSVVIHTLKSFSDEDSITSSEIPLMSDIVYVVGMFVRLAGVYI